jgi:hypothetical protein
LQQVVVRDHQAPQGEQDRLGVDYGLVRQTGDLESGLTQASAERAQDSGQM